MFKGIRLSPETLQIIAEETEDYGIAAAMLQCENDIVSFRGHIMSVTAASMLADGTRVDSGFWAHLDPWEEVTDQMKADAEAKPPYARVYYRHKVTLQHPTHYVECTLQRSNGHGWIDADIEQDLLDTRHAW
jgi:hypothetical protein